MFTPLVLKRPPKPEGESPFWISFSDLMSALMVLFLVVMAVTLISVTKDVTTTEQRKIQREKDIKELMSTIREVSREFPEIKVNESTYRIDLGEIVRFDRGRSDIQPAGAAFLRRYVPVLLKAQNSDLGRQWIRRVVVEGFTDQDGTYLYNLGLSLDRSRKVVCVLFSPAVAGEAPLTDAEKKKVRDLFLVGGYSFNSMKASKEESRRVELRVDFWQLDETKDSAPDLSGTEFGQC
ncbi:OmpA family protein [Ramlibacter sp. XY19]|uniref:OmpA/MotB family protein n=1 Tax=Ramlibacter paludis TaxID=2908000 RepID=UPI0023DBEADB|nr:OmpA family protein [Ramlibacter paludis]MCG2593012.1 OmpA family protein [Ramlibacter paludis]